MGDHQKYQAGEILGKVKHMRRDLSDGHADKRCNIDHSKTNENYSLVNRGKSVKEIMQYRDKLLSQTFYYNRKNIVHGVSICIQLPRDCPKSQEKEFFQAVHDFVSDRLVKLGGIGEDQILVSEVHRDEPNSLDHIHILYIPIVKDTSGKHPEFSQRLCADQLTKMASYKTFHRDLQDYLDSKHIHATVTTKKYDDGKRISLTIPQLRTISKITGIKRDHALTVEELGQIIKTGILTKEQLQLANKEIEKLRAEKQEVIEENISLKNQVKELDMTKKELEKLQSEKEELQKKLQEKVQERSHIHHHSHHHVTHEHEEEITY